ncbi:MAG: phage major capsid protein [Niabella sp.]|nr:phage major capsid protein [Niabella sp.]
MSQELLNGVKQVGEKIDQYKADTEKKMNAFEAKFDQLEAGTARQMAGGGLTKSFNEILTTEVEKQTDNIAKLIRGEKHARASFEIKAAGVVTTANVTGGSVYGAVYKPGIVEMPQNQSHMRDFLPVIAAPSGNEYYFMRELAGQGNPAAVAEGLLKPQYDSQLQETSVKFETIAGWELLSRKALANIPGLTSFIQTRALTKLLDAEDNLYLYGDGVSPNIKGILTSGNYIASVATGPLVERILSDLGTFEDVYKRKATAILLRPANYWSFFANKATGSGEYDLPFGVTFVGNQLYLWGVPVYKMNALATNAGTPATNDYMLGDFANGAHIMQQDGIRLEFFEQDSDNVRKNLITLRVETTVALPVFRNDGFMGGKI